MPDFRRPLPEPIGTIKPIRMTIRSLKDAAAYMTEHLGPREHFPEWQSAADLVLAAANGGDVSAAAKQIRLALLLNAALDVRENLD
jgi:hypothetical protein